MTDGCVPTHSNTLIVLTLTDMKSNIVLSVQLLGKARLPNFIRRLVGHHKLTISRLIDDHKERNICTYPFTLLT